MKARIKRSARHSLERFLAKWGYQLASGLYDPPSDPWLDRAADDATPLPPEADEDLRADHPRLVEFQKLYADLDWSVCDRSRWRTELMDSWWDLRYFRGDTPYVWHYRESERVSKLKFFVYLRCVLERDPLSLVSQLGEDGAFGCWTYRFPGYPACSRELLDSVTELYFLERHSSYLSGADVRVLDIGAGYGRLAHRSAQAVPGLTDYCCVDTIPESTYLSEYYARFRGVSPPVRIISLPDVVDLVPDTFDIAFNVHSFSECSFGAVRWWFELLERLRVPRLFLVPNESSGFLTLEPDGSRLDYAPLIADAGYVLVAEERALADAAVRELIQIEDRFCLFERTK